MDTVITRRPSGSPPRSGEPSAQDLRDAATVFSDLRPALLRIAGRILRDPAEAEDVVQEAWVRWQRADRAAVRSSRAFLTTATTRLALNAAQSARARHEALVPGPLVELPEQAQGGEGPEATVEHHESAELALRIVLERLRPAERGPYVLRKAFGYPYERIAAVLGVSVTNARQLVSRGHARLGIATTAEADPWAHRRLVEAFWSASRRGDLAELEAVLADAGLARAA